MPVETSYLPRPSTRNDPRITVSLVWRSMLADLIDVFQHLNRAFASKQLQQLRAARALCGRDPDKRNIGGPCATSIVDRVPDVQQFLRWPESGDLQKSIRRRFFLFHIVGRDQQKAFAKSFTIQRNL